MLLLLLLLGCGLVVEGNQESVSPRVVKTRCIWLIGESILEDLAEDLRTHVVLEYSFEDFVLWMACLGGVTLIDEV